ncbi:lipopolysaccharide assembly protein LapB [Synechococcus sp. ROS8604]|uniref:tetratricopeptide repeat protein n=1 Tax=Synechococcus sp. ROS8604 TaxID=1442557 RepID=UPI0016464E34|nr:hypothetical protein [Synechococcus sp. ROS8604]QNI87351.1 tetratricopeptide repeat family protein [Synechococcus sp. ROS8604]
MSDWKTFADKIKKLLKSKDLSAAKEELAIGLEKLPNQINLLTIATNIYRASGDREKSLEYSELLITHHPDNWNGYGRAAQELVALKRFEEAQKQIQSGLEKLPNQVNLLTIATDVFRASNDREKSLEYSELLITHHPDNWNGYGRAAQDLVALKRLEEAKIKVQKGFRKKQNQFILLYEDEFLRILAKHVQESTTCIVNCGGALLNLESTFVDTDFENANVFRIIDKEETWSNSIDTDVLKDFFALFGSFSEVVAIGVSSNATSALFLGPLLNAKTIIAFSPQYTVFPDYNPSLFATMRRNKRVAKRINSIKEWKYKSLKNVDKHGSQEFVFSGDTKHDLSQYKSFLENPIKERRCIPIKLTRHCCNSDLERSKILSPLIKLCLGGASESDCIQLLNKGGFEIYNELPEGITASFSEG